MLIVHLRFCRLAAQPDSAAVTALCRLLPPSERERCARLPGIHATRAVMARALVRCQLAGALSVEPQALDFVAGPHGKPALLDPPRPITFNLSHSGDWAVLAWHMAGDAAPLGVDIEQHRPGARDVMRLARRYFSRAELQSLEDLAGEARDMLFYRLWTLKEAWVKAHGLALAPQLGAIAFAVSGQRIAVENGTAQKTGHFLQGEPEAGIAASLCLLDRGDRQFSVDARMGMPLGDWSPISLAEWRESLAGASPATLYSRVTR